jgi:hypothetical protein
MAISLWRAGRRSDGQHPIFTIRIASKIAKNISKKAIQFGQSFVIDGVGADIKDNAPF